MTDYEDSCLFLAHDCGSARLIHPQKHDSYDTEQLASISNASEDDQPPKPV